MEAISMSSTFSPARVRLVKRAGRAAKRWQKGREMPGKEWEGAERQVCGW
jgi:hypothetical protein